MKSIKLKMVNIRKFDVSNKELAEIAFKIRNQVFVVEQNVAAELEYDIYEQEAHHYLVYFENNAVGTARWRETDVGVKLERFAVLREFRNQGIGEELLKTVLADVIKLNKLVYLHSQDMAVVFYERSGFKKIDNPFYEANIKHFKMIYTNEKQ